MKSPHAYSISLLFLILFLGCGRHSSKKSNSSLSSEVSSEYTGSLAATGQMRRLSKIELDHTVSALLGHDGHLALLLPPDDESMGYTNGKNLGIVQLFIDQWQLFAQQIATTGTQSGSPLAREFEACLPAQGEAMCADRFIRSFGKKAFRRPLSDQEVSDFQKVYASGKILGTNLQGLELIVEACLLSPSFLYRTELGAEAVAVGATYDLSPYELASSLAYTLTSFPPDAELMEAADSGAILAADVLQKQAERLLASPRALNIWRDFVFEWLRIKQVDSINRLHPLFSSEMPAAFRQETEAFIDSVFTEGQGSLISLLDADYSFLNSKIAVVYDAPAPQGSAVSRVGLNAGERRGILTQGSFLGVHAQIAGSAPVRRGHVILERLFCENLPAPPPGVAVVPQEIPNATTRERFAAHSSQSSCQGCHVQMDAIGFAFEHYDGIGHFRTMENGKSVDATGALADTTAAPGSFSDAIELIDHIAQSERVHECVVKQMFRYSMGRHEGALDQLLIADSLSRASANAMDLRQALLAFVTSQQFKQRIKTGL